MKDEKILECILCCGRFSVDDVRHGIFFASTMICAACYIEGAASKGWCFGEYEKEHPTCLSKCPDAEICERFAGNKTKTRHTTKALQNQDSAVSSSR